MTAVPASIAVLAAERPRSGSALFAVALAGFSAFIGLYATMPLLPLLQQVFGASKAEVGLTVSASTIAMALASPFAGPIARRFGFRRTIVTALLVLPLPLLVAAAARTVAALIAARFLQGLLVPCIYAVAIAYLSVEWPPDALGRAMSMLITGNAIGSFSGRFLSGIIADHLGGWRVAFVVLAALTTIAAALVAWLLPRDGASPEEHAATSAHVGALGALRERALLATFAIGFMALFVQIATFTYVTFHLSAPPFGLDASALSYLFTVYLLGAAVTPFAGRWIDRVGPRHAITVSLLVATGGELLTLAPSLPVVVAGLTALCTGLFASFAAATTYLRTAAPPRFRSTAPGIYISVFYVGGAVGGVLPAAAWRVAGWTACVALVVTVQIATVLLARRAWVPGGSLRTARRQR